MSKVSVVQSHSKIRNEIYVKEEPSELLEDSLTADEKFCVNDDINLEPVVILKEENEMIFPTYPSEMIFPTYPSGSLEREKTDEADLQENNNENRNDFSESIGERVIKNRLNKPHLNDSDTKHLYSCSDCDYETKRKRIIEHLKCDFGTSRKTPLVNVHILNLSDSRKFQCPQCPYASYRKDKLNSHMLTHSDKKLFSCSKCDYETNHKRDLNIHLLNHSDSRMFKCSECQYGTNHKGNLKSHMNIHFNSKLFKCPECEFNTLRQYDLRRHLLTHSDSKLYNCPTCDFGTNRKYLLKKHNEKH